MVKFGFRWAHPVAVPTVLAIACHHGDFDGDGHDNDGRVDLAVFAPGLYSRADVSNPLYLYSGSGAGPTDWQTLALP